MAIFAVSRNKIGWPFSPGGGRRFALAALAVPSLLLALGAGAARAQTVGNPGGTRVVDGNEILFQMVGTGGLLDPTDPTKVVDLTKAFFGFIKNPYLGVVQGVTGSYTISFPNGAGTNVSFTYNVPGMITIGNQIGSLRTGADDRWGLTGDQADPSGYGVWPLASQWEQTIQGLVVYDYPAFVNTSVDGAVTNAVAPFAAFEHNVLHGTAALQNNVNLNQEIRLFRATAQLHWTLTNNDTAAHQVGLRFVANVHDSYFYEDPTRGITNDPNVLRGSNIPDQLTIYGKRYEPDANADPNNPPFAARLTFRTNGATTPDHVTITDNLLVRPNANSYDVNPLGTTVGQLAVAVFYGPYNLGPGQSADIFLYYGNGAVTEQLNTDFVSATEATESLAYNSAAATADGVAGNVGADPSTVGTQFLTPNPLQIFAGIYNRAESNPQTSLNLTNVHASLTLPKGLALTTPPNSTTVDTAEKVMGDNGAVNSDRGSDVSWYVKPTGDVIGAVAYQVNVTTKERGAQQVTRTISIPATPFHPVTASSFQMIGFPFQFDPQLSNNGDPATVVNALSSPKDDSPIFYQWVGDPQSLTGAGHYEVVNKLATGVGYMYKSNVDRTIFAKGVQPTPKQAQLGSTDFTNSNQFQLSSLPRGWVMISNPYLYDIPLKFLRFVPSDNNANGGSQTFDQAVSSGLIRGGVFFLDTTTNSYDFFDQSTNTLAPWQAYWFYLNSPLTLIFSTPTQRNSAVLPDPNGNEPPTRGVIAGGRAVSKNPTVDDWSQQIVATQQGSKGNTTDKATIIGVSNGSSVANATRSIPKPPAPYADYVYTSIVPSDTKTTRLAKDIRSGRGAQTWEIEVASDKGGPVTLTWPNVNRLPRRVTLTLQDSATGKRYTMRSASSVTVSVAKDHPSRFVVTSKTGVSLPLTISPLHTVATRGQGFSVAFSLSREATVSGTIQTLSGKVIATLATGRAATAGENRIQWSGRAQNGSPLAPGPYMVEIIARDGDEVSHMKGNFMSLD